MTSFSFSKSYGMAGYRAGYLQGPRDAIAGAHKLHTHSTYSAADTVAVRRARRAARRRRWLAETREHYRAAGADAAHVLGVAAPEGSTFLFLDVRDRLGSARHARLPRGRSSRTASCSRPARRAGATTRASRGSASPRRRPSRSRRPCGCSRSGWPRRRPESARPPRRAMSDAARVVDLLAAHRRRAASCACRAGCAPRVTARASRSSRSRTARAWPASRSSPSRRSRTTRAKSSRCAPAARSRRTASSSSHPPPASASKCARSRVALVGGDRRRLPAPEEAPLLRVPAHARASADAHQHARRGDARAPRGVARDPPLLRRTRFPRAAHADPLDFGLRRRRLDVPRDDARSRVGAAHARRRDRLEPRLLRAPGLPDRLGPARSGDRRAGAVARLLASAPRSGPRTRTPAAISPSSGWSSPRSRSSISTATPRSPRSSCAPCCASCSSTAPTTCASSTNASRRASSRRSSTSSRRPSSA